MSKILKTLTTLILALCLSVFFVACDDENGGDAGDATTGELVYELVTGERTVNEGTDDETTEEYEYYKITGYTVTSDDAIKMANGDFESVKGKREITIPAKHPDGKPVEEIGASAFADRIILTKVTFEDGNNIKTIGADAFSGCTNLEEIVNLPFIGKSADAVGAERVLGHIFGSSTTRSEVTSVSAKAYDELTTTDLTFKFPNSLKKISVNGDIPECAFYGMSMLKEVVFDSAKSVGASAFSGCTKLVEVKMPSVEFIYDNAFSGCTALQRVNFEGNTVLSHIGDGAFSGCSYLGYNYVTDEESVVKVVIPDTVTYLGYKAFSGCSLLKYVELGTLVTEIQTGTFADCSELIKVSAKSPVAVKVSAFAGCNKDNLELYVGGVKTAISDLAFGEYNA